MLKRFPKEQSKFGSTLELEVDFDQPNPVQYLSSYVSGVGRRMLEPLWKNKALSSNLGVRAMRDTLAYSPPDKKDIVFVRFNVNGTDQSLGLFLKEIQRSGLRLGLASMSPWIITDDDRILPNSVATEAAVTVAKAKEDGTGLAQNGPTSGLLPTATPVNPSDARAATIQRTDASSQKRSSTTPNDEEVSRPAKRVKSAGMPLPQTPSQGNGQRKGKDDEGEWMAGVRKEMAEDPDDEKAKQKAAKKTRKQLKSRAKEKEKKQETKRRKEHEEGRERERIGNSEPVCKGGRGTKDGGQRTAGSPFAPYDGHPEKSDHKRAANETSFTFVRPRSPTVGQMGREVPHEQKRMEQKDEGRRLKREEPDGRVSRNPRVSTADTETTGVTGVSKGAQSSFVFGPTARPVNNQSGRDVRHEQRPVEKNGEGKKRKMQASDREFELKGRGSSLGTQRTIATEENYRTQASRHSTPMSIAPPNRTAAVQGGRHVEWRSYKQWKGLVPVSNSSSQPEPERPHGDRSGYQNPPWRNPFDTRPKYRAHSNYFPGAILPKSPGKSPAYVEGHARGVTVIVWSEEAQRLPVRYARPYIPRPKDPPSAPYEMPGPAFDASIMDDMFASHARLKAEQAEIAKLGKRKRGGEDDGADAAVDSDNDDPHAPRKRPRGSSDVQ